MEINGKQINDNYFMLRKTECPLVIVECGYMSNHKEAALLLDEEYQEKLAWDSFRYYELY